MWSTYQVTLLFEADWIDHGESFDPLDVQDPRAQKPGPVIGKRRNRLASHHHFHLPFLPPFLPLHHLPLQAHSISFSPGGPWNVDMLFFLRRANADGACLTEAEAAAKFKG